MNKYILTIIIILCCTSLFAQKHNNRWIRNFVSRTVELVDEVKTSNSIRNKLITSFQISTLEAKKALRKLDLSYEDIEKITKRYSLNELEDIVRQLDGLSPNATRLFISDLARYSSDNKKMKNLINVIKKDKRVLNAYERVSTHMGVKYRTDAGVLLQIADKKRPIKIHTSMSANRKESYIKKTISVNGLVFEGYFPNFKKHSSFSTLLPKQLIIAGDDEQMKYATRQLRKNIKKKPSLRNKFTPEQLKAIDEGKRKIPGLTWHHSESPVGAMDLVDEKIHNSLSHDGGNTFWGGGVR